MRPKALQLGNSNKRGCRWPRRRAYRPLLERLETRLAPANVDVVRYHNDLFLSGQNLQEETLTPANVNATNFGTLFSQLIDGQAYAQPLYKHDLVIPGRGTHNVAFVATEHDSVYAFDADSNSGPNAMPIWHNSYTDPEHGITTIPFAELSTPDIFPEIGITGTPVMDTSTNTLYVVVKTKEVRSMVIHYVQKLHALELATGDEKFNGPYTIGDSIRSNEDQQWIDTTEIYVNGQGGGAVGGRVFFNAARESDRMALQLVGNIVYIAFASHADFRPYHGWVIGFDKTTLRPIKVLNTSPNADAVGIWESGGGLSFDEQGNMFFAVGNGFANTSPPFSQFDPANGNYSESVLKVDPTPNWTPANPQMMTVVDYFTPFDWQDLDRRDADLGSGGVILLPDGVGSTAHRHLLVETGKSGKIYLIDRDTGHMGRFTPGGPDNVVQITTAGQTGVWGNPSFFQIDATNGILYYHGSGDVLKGYYVSNGRIEDGTRTGDRPILRSNTDVTFSRFPGAQPVLSANGIVNPVSPANGITWELQVDNAVGRLQMGGGDRTVAGAATLRAFNPTNLDPELYDSGHAGTNGAEPWQRDLFGGSVKFTVPVVTNGHVLVATADHFSVLGLFPQAMAPPAAPSNLSARLRSAADGPQVELNWTNPAPNPGADPTGIRIFRSTDGTNFTPYNAVNRNLTTFTDVGPFQFGQRYYYRVGAFNQRGGSAVTDPVNVLVPIPPAALTLAGIGAQNVALSWTNVANDHYDLERSTDGTNYSRIATLPNFRTTYTDTGLAPGTYSYRVRAFNVGPDADSLSNVQGAWVGPTIDHGNPATGGFTNATDITANGSAFIITDLLRLTAADKETGSAFSSTRMAVSRFTTSFQVRLHEGTQPDYADGFVFVLQANAPTALGQGGAGIGYQGIGNSVAVKFSTFQHAGDPSSSSTGLVVNGANPGGGIDTIPSDVRLDSQDPKQINLTYDGTTLSEQIEDLRTGRVFRTSFTINIPQVMGSDTAYVGFTGASGSGGSGGHGFYELEDILSWRFTSQAPLPGGPTNLRVASSTSSQIDLAWNPNSFNETGFRVERASDGINFIEIGTTATASFQDLGLPNGAYFYRVRAFNASGASPYTTALTANLPNPLLAADQDIGTLGDPAIRGSATFANDTYSLAASGSDIWTTADHFHYVYRPFRGDGEIVARLVSEQAGVNDFAKAGVMFRESLAAGAKNAFMLEFPFPGSRGFPTLQWRPDTGVSTMDHQFTGPNPPHAPIWLRLARSSNTFSGYWALDTGGGTHGDWNLLDQESVVMRPDVFVGLAVTSHNNGSLLSAAFDHAQVLPVGPTARLDVSADAFFVAPGAPVNITVQALDSFNNPTTNYRGTVRFASSDPALTLPADYTFVAADNGRHTFSVAPRTLGRQTLTVADIANGFMSGTAVTVTNQFLGSLLVSGFPSPVVVGTEGSFTVAAKDTNGNPFPDYRGTIHFVSSDPRAVLPLDYTFTPADSGSHTFRATLNSLGTQSITATDRATLINRGQSNIIVNPLDLVVVDHPGGFAANSDLQANGTARFVPNATPVGTFVAHQDIGDVGQDGSATFADGIYTVKGSGADVWSTSDGFQFVYKSLTGNGEIVARVLSDEFTNDSAKVGVMIRETLTAESKNAFVQKFPQRDDGTFRPQSPVFQWRPIVGGPTMEQLNLAVEPPPVWLRLVRADNSFTGYWAHDTGGGTHGDWIRLGPGPQTIVMGPSAFVGLAVTAHNRGALDAATFDHVTVLGDTSGSPPSPPMARITDGGTNQAGSFFAKTVVPITTFTTTFTIQDRPAIRTPPANLPGEGVTFVIQGNSASALGGNGGGMGYAGLGKSAAVKFDLRRNRTGLYLGGQSPSDTANPGLDMAPAGIDLASGHPFSVTLTYDGIGLGELVTDTVTGAFFSTAYDVNLGEQLGANGGYVGFTGGTSGDTAVQDIVRWTARFSRLSPTGSFMVSGFSSPTRAGAEGAFTVMAKAPNGNPNPDYRGTVHFTSSDRRADLPADYTFTAADAGMHTFQATLLTPGTQVISATDRTNRVTGSQFGIVVNANPAVLTTGDFTFVAVAGITSRMQTVATFTDPAGPEGLSHYAATINWGDNSNSTGVIIGPNNDGVFTVQGSHNFATGGDYTIRVTIRHDAAPDATATSTASVSDLVLHFQVQGFPSPITSGTPGTFTVTAMDQLDEAVQGYRGTVTFSSSDSQAFLPADYAFTDTDNGTHSFAAVLRTVGTQSIIVTDTAAPDVTGTQEVIVAPARFIVSGFPSPTTAGNVGMIRVMVVDADSTLVTGYTGTIHFSSSDSQADLPEDYTFTTDDQGVHTFEAVLKTAGTQRLVTTDANLASLNGGQADIDVDPSPVVSYFIVSGFPSPVMAGTPGTFMVTAYDAYANVATGYTGSVTFSSTDPEAAIPAPYTFADSDTGRHSFHAALFTKGMQSIIVTDTRNGATGQQDVLVTAGNQPSAPSGPSGASAALLGQSFAEIAPPAQTATGQHVASYSGLAKPPVQIFAPAPNFQRLLPPHPRSRDLADAAFTCGLDQVLGDWNGELFHGALVDDLVHAYLG